jgi:Zn finger protein HypA/HybF involved in hydrogenase expression
MTEPTTPSPWDWRQPVERECPQCGERMQERNCKIICPRCGASADCSDP